MATEFLTTVLLLAAFFCLPMLLVGIIFFFTRERIDTVDHIPTCAVCQYDLVGLTEDTPCPECGQSQRVGTLRKIKERNPHANEFWRLLLLIPFVLFAPFASLSTLWLCWFMRNNAQTANELTIGDASHGYEGNLIWGYIIFSILFIILAKTEADDPRTMFRIGLGTFSAGWLFLIAYTLGVWFHDTSVYLVQQLQIGSFLAFIFALPVMVGLSFLFHPPRKSPWRNFRIG